MVVTSPKQSPLRQAPTGTPRDRSPSWTADGSQATCHRYPERGIPDRHNGRALVADTPHHRQSHTGLERFSRVRSALAVRPSSTAGARSPWYRCLVRRLGTNAGIGRGVSSWAHHRPVPGRPLPDRVAVHPRHTTARFGHGQHRILADASRGHIRDIDCTTLDHTALGQTNHRSLPGSRWVALQQSVRRGALYRPVLSRSLGDARMARTLTAADPSRSGPSDRRGCTASRLLGNLNRPRRCGHN